MDLLDGRSELVLVAEPSLEDGEVVELQVGGILIRLLGEVSEVVRILVEGLLGRSDEDQVSPLAFLGRFGHFGRVRPSEKSPRESESEGCVRTSRLGPSEWVTRVKDVQSRQKGTASRLQSAAPAVAPRGLIVVRFRKSRRARRRISP